MTLLDGHALVIGKFCPLHKGHQFLIGKALDTVRDVTVILMDMPGFPQFPIEMRQRWLADIYGDKLKAIVAVPDNHNGDSSPEAAPLYAADVAPFGPFTHVFSSESYGDPFAKALGAQHVMADQMRVQFPVSGTKVRQDAFWMRGWLHPRVYRDMIQKVAFVGGESTGKSTIAKQLAFRYDSQWTHEYGRELWEEQGGTGSFSDLLKIGVEQYRREEEAIKDSNKYLFCDTTALTTEYWCRHYYGTADQRLIDLVERTQHEYIYFLCDNDFPFVQDGLRETEDFAEKFHQGVIEDLERRGLEYIVLRGSIEERKAKVMAELAARERKLQMQEQAELDIAAAKKLMETSDVAVCCT